MSRAVSSRNTQSAGRPEQALNASKGGVRSRWIRPLLSGWRRERPTRLRADRGAVRCAAYEELTLTQPEIRTIEIQPRTPLGWLAAIVVLAVTLTLAFFLFTIFLVAAGVGVLVLPVVTWWRNRKLKGRRAGASEVIDAEYVVHARETPDD